MFTRWIVCFGVLGCMWGQALAQQAEWADAPAQRALPAGLAAEGNAPDPVNPSNQPVPPAAARSATFSQALPVPSQAMATASQVMATASQTAVGEAATEGNSGQHAFISPEQAVAEALQTILQGYRFNKRLLAQDRRDHWLLFTRGANETALVGWTERQGTETERLALAPASPMAFTLYSYSGEQIRAVETVGYEIGMVLEREPKVLLPTAPNAYLMLAAAAQTLPPVMRVRGPQALELSCEFYNPLDIIAIMPVPDMGKTIAIQPGGVQTIRKEIAVGRSSEPIYTSIGAMGIRQPVTIVIENPIELVMRPEEPQVLTLDVINTSGEEINGAVLLSLADGSEPFRLPLEFRRGQRLNTVRIPLSTPLPLPTPMVVTIEQTVGQPMRRTYELAQTGALQFAPALSFRDMEQDGSPTGYRAQASGGASAALRGGLPERASVPWPDYGVLGLVYDLGSAADSAAGAAQIDIVPVAEWASQIVGMPGQVGFWLQSDGSGNLISLVLSGADGTQYATEERALDWRGWRYVLFSLPQGVDNYPLNWASLIRLRAGDNPNPRSRRGALLANGFCFIYGDNFSRSGYLDPSLAQYESGVSTPAAPATVSEPQIERGEPIRRGGGH